MFNLTAHPQMHAHCARMPFMKRLIKSSKFADLELRTRATVFVGPFGLLAYVRVAALGPIPKISGTRC